MALRHESSYRTVHAGNVRLGSNNRSNTPSHHPPDHEPNRNASPKEKREEQTVHDSASSGQRIVGRHWFSCASRQQIGINLRNSSSVIGSRSNSVSGGGGAMYGSLLPGKECWPHCIASKLPRLSGVIRAPPGSRCLPCAARRADGGGRPSIWPAD